MNKFITLSAVLLLSGCSTYQWVKPGSNANDATIAETKCEAQALRDLPPDNVVSSTYTTKDKKNKTSDTSYSVSDANESKRKVLIKDCMYSKGWSQIETQS